MTNGEYLRRTLKEMETETPPKRRTEKFILGQISFYESGAEFYAQHDQASLAEWSRAMAEEWQGKLKALKMTETSGEGLIQ